MSRLNLVEEPDRYQHEPFVFVNTIIDKPIPAATFTKLRLDSVAYNDLGAWDVGLAAFVCPRAGRITTETTCVFNTGGGGTCQLVLRVDDAAGNYVTRFILNQFGSVGAGLFYTLNGTKSFGVELGMRVYPELFLSTAGGYEYGQNNLPPLGSYFTTTFCAYYVP